ncbi:AraC-like DNA-binding protein [Rhodococcus fascians]|uniref:AraC family transcriptional regulator n=1 Tax=Nocardiaceae TaxID=85025 RepID=UPI00285D1B02|nr:MULTISPECIES: AraC family transcriptional regulator [Rhodococcus]MDR6910781.1 AraC-like DNA-binding protein [Rhodococcus sp. 3258]MDR6931852.1 AraC-like DNA-binding protein [Rhodococcus fascians]
MEQRLLLDTTDPEEASRSIASSYNAHDLSITDDVGLFRARQTEVVLDRIAIHRLRYGAAVTIRSIPLSSCYLVTAPIRGGLTIRSQGRAIDLGPGEVVAIDPSRAFDLEWLPGTELRTVRLPSTLVDGLAGAGASKRVPFELSAALPAQSRMWSALVDLVEMDATSEALQSSGLLARELATALAVALIDGHPSLHVPIQARDVGIPRNIRRAISVLESHPDQALDVQELAETAGLSVRALQMAFRTYLGATPSELLRDIRLDLVRSDLLRAQPGNGPTIADIAYRWGFGNLGRFSVAYRLKFGELPSQTMRFGAG